MIGWFELNAELHVLHTYNDDFNNETIRFLSCEL